MRPLMVGGVALLALVTGCDQVFGLSRPPDAPVLPDCVRDDFDDGLIDSATWRIVTPGNAPIVITETAGRLRFKHPMLLEGNNALETVQRFDLTGGYLQVELAEPPSLAGFLDTNVVVVLDPTNYYMLNVGGSDLVYRITKDGVKDDLVEAYKASDRYWRIRHDAATDEIVFEISANGALFVERRRVAATVPVTSLTVQLAGDSFQGGPPVDATAGWDNLELVGPNCQ